MQEYIEKKETTTQKTIVEKELNLSLSGIEYSSPIWWNVTDWAPILTHFMAPRVPFIQENNMVF